MVYFNPAEMTPGNKKLLQEWLVEEGLDQNVIAGDGTFSVHNRTISGFIYLLNAEGKILMVKNKAIRVPFRKPQRNPLPDWSI